MGTLSVFANKHAPWYSQGRMLDAWIGRVRAWLSRRSVRIALIAAALGFYGYWVTARVDRARTGDFYVYYVAASAFAANLDAYAMTRSEFAAHAERLQVPSHAYPYYYPTLPALLVWPLTALPPKAAALVWSSMSAATMVGGALLLGLSSAHAFGITLALVHVTY